MIEKTPEAAIQLPHIQISFSYQGFASDQTAMVVSWRGTEAPSDVIFEADFVSHPSGTVSELKWGANRDILDNIYVEQGDTLVEIKSAWATAEDITDLTGKTGSVWEQSETSNPVIEFQQGREVTVDLLFDPTQMQIRNRKRYVFELPAWLFKR